MILMLMVVTIEDNEILDDNNGKDNDYLDIVDHHSLLGVGVLAASLKVATTAL